LTGPRQPTTSEGRKPFGVAELEELGAYIEGALDAERSRRVAKRLLEDQAFFDVYAEALEFQQWEEPPAASDRESEPLTQAAERAPPAAPLPPPTKFRRWLQAAALAALVAGGFWSVTTLRTPSQPVMDLAGQLAESVVSAPTALAWSRLDWFEPRSAIPQLGLSSDAIVARLGVRLVQVQVAHQQSDLDELRPLVAEVERLCNAGDLEAGHPRYSSAFRLGSWEQAEHPRFAQQVEETQTALREAAHADGLAEVFAVAQWAELGRLGSRFGDHEVLESSTFRRLQKRWRDHVFELGVAGALSDALRALEMEETDELEARFTELILALAS